MGSLVSYSLDGDVLGEGFNNFFITRLVEKFENQKTNSVENWDFYSFYFPCQRRVFEITKNF